MANCVEESPIPLYDIVVPQGADWDVAIRYEEPEGTPVDFSTATARCQIRVDYDKEIILELSSASGTIQLGDGTGGTPNVVLKFTSGNTSALSLYDGIYDLEVTLASGLVKKFLAGKFKLYREVTK
jgi:hypothetical protein